MCKLVAGFMKDKNSWTGCAVSAAVLCYLIQALFNISSVTSSPYFWIAAGLVWSFTAVKSSAKKKELTNLSVRATLGRPLFHQYIDKKFGRSKMSPIFYAFFAGNDINILALHILKYGYKPVPGFFTHK